MNKTLNKILLGLASLFLTHVALADNTGKVYISADFGKAIYNNANVTLSGTTNTFPNPNALMLAVGYHASSTLAFELGYTKPSESSFKLSATAPNLNLDTTAVTVSTVITHQINSSFNIFGRVGISNNTAKTSLSGGWTFSDGSSSKTESQKAILYGLGIGYTLSDSTTLRAQYINYGSFTTKTIGLDDDLSTSIVSLGLLHNF